MNEIKTSCAPADSRNLTWDGMNWSKCETYVRKLQARIVKAQKEGRHNKVKTLQWMLTHSFYAKALAVKRVTSNKGKNTSGVDKQLWDSPKRKYCNKQILNRHFSVKLNRHMIFETLRL